MGAPNHPLNPKPIFVVGPMHSGTTLLRHILQRNSDVFSGRGESKYFDHLPMIRRDYQDLDDDSTLRDFVLFAAYIVRHGYKLKRANKIKSTDIGITDRHFQALLLRAKQHREHDVIFRIIFDYLTQSSGKARWLEKTPTHVFHIDQIVSSMPDAQFVEIVRDARDVLASKKTRRLTVWTDRYKPEQRPIKHLEKAYDPIWDALSWKSAIRAGQIAHEKYPGRIFSIRYEELVANPEVRVQEICEFLKLGFEPDMLNIASRNAAEWDKRTDKGIAQDSIGRWQRVLTPVEVALCQSLVGTELNNLGYQLVPIKNTDRVKVFPIVGRSMFEFLQRLSKRWRLGGFAYFVNVLVNYWKRMLKLYHS